MGLLARLTQPAQAFEVNVALPTIALMKAPLPPPAANDRLGAVIDIAPVVATTAAGPLLAFFIVRPQHWYVGR